MTPKPFLHRRITSCSRHLATRIRSPDVGPHRPAGIGGVTEDKLSMLELYAFRRSLVSLALCAAAFAVSVTPASARSHHGARRYGHAHYTGLHARRHYARQYNRRFARGSRWDPGGGQMQPLGPARPHPSP